jgi:hypothetical protein
VIAGRLKSGPTAQAASPVAASPATSRHAAMQWRRLKPPLPASLFSHCNALAANIAAHCTCAFKQDEPHFG